jgi:ABC-2 type transport system permease protein
MHSVPGNRNCTSWHRVNVKAYRTIFVSRFLTLLQYRAAAVAGVATQLFFGLVRVMIYDGFYRSSSMPQPMTAEQVVTYIWLGQAMLMLVMLDVDRDVAAMIRTGNVAYEMTRPLDLYTVWYIRALSGRAAPLILRAVPIFIVAVPFLGLNPPASAVDGVLFFISLFNGLLLAAALVALMTISLLWTVSGEGIYRLAGPLVFFFSGLVIPLPLFPDWMQQLIAFLPFRALVDTPFRLYLGMLTGMAAVTALAHQIFWTVAFVLVGRAILTGHIRRLVVQGG